MDFDAALKDASSVHQIELVKDVQRMCLKSLILDKRDVLVRLPTGYGKSFIFQAWPTIIDRMNGRQGSIVVVVCPLLAIMEEQVQLLRKKGISAAFIGESDESDKLIAAGEFSVMFGSPEALVGQSKWRKVLQTTPFQERPC